MLKPFWRETWDWIPPPSIVHDGAPRSHFGLRAIERGFVYRRGDVLKWAVERAVALGRDDLAEFVCNVDQKGGSRIFRVLLPAGPAYPVIKRDGTAATIYSQDEIRGVKAARRFRRRHFGSAERGADE